MKPLAPSLVLLLLTILSGILTIAKADPCEPPWTWVDDQCYLFSSFTGEKLGWHEARHYCQTYNIFSDLVVIRPDLKEYSTIRNYMNLNRVDGVWLGASDEGHEMSWLYVDNRPVDLFMPLWHCDSPEYDHLSNCGALVSYLSGDYYDRVTMTDEYCEKPMYFICQMNVHYMEGYNPSEEKEELKRIWGSEDQGSLLGDLEENNFAAFQEEDYVI